MNYHNILHDDMRNGTGLRVTLFVSGCNNKCDGCQNPQTWDVNNGIPFNTEAYQEIMEALEKPYITGVTLSGGDPMHEHNTYMILCLCADIKHKFPDKTIWVYTGYTFEQLCDDNTSVWFDILKYTDVLVDGKFVQELADVNYHWAGSTNQRVIDVQETLRQDKIILYKK